MRALFALVLAPLLFGCAASAPDDLGDSEDEVKQSDAIVEIKMMLAEVDTGPSALGVDDKSVERRAVTFYDTLDLQLLEAGTILRSRKVTDGADDATIKLRPMKASAVDPKLLSDDGFKCEYDKAVGVAAVSSCSLTRERKRGAIGAVARGDDSIESLFTSSQRDWLESEQAMLSSDWSELHRLGPIAAEVWKLEPSGMDGDEVTVERWDVPRGARSLEVSIKVKGSVARAREAKLVAWVASRGLHASTQQETKTKAALNALVAP